MIDPILIGSGVLSSKKMALGVIGMAGATSGDLIKIWPILAVLLVPLATGTFYAGRISEQLRQMNDHRIDDIKGIENKIDAAFEARDYKLNLAYERAIKGKRYTLDMGIDAENRIKILESKASGHSRFMEEGKELENRIATIESRCYEVELNQRVFEK